MDNNFFIGDTFMSRKNPLSQTAFSFMGAKKQQDSSCWEISVLAAMENGYAGRGSTIVWEIELNEKLRVSIQIKGYFITDGLNKQKIKEYSIKEALIKAT